MYTIAVVEHEQLFLTCSSLQEFSDMLRVRVFLEHDEHKKAFNLLEVYLKKGRPEAEYLYSKMPNEMEGTVEAHHINYITRSAKKDYPPALYILGAYYDTGDYVELNKAKAAFLFKQAALCGHAHSQWIHGEDLLYGRNGIEQNKALGIEYIKKSADAKFEGALETMASFYQTGKYGFPIDPDKANYFKNQIKDEDSLGY
jgi:TPR repeat protein